MFSLINDLLFALFFDSLDWLQIKFGSPETKKRVMEEKIREKLEWRRFMNDMHTLKNIVDYNYAKTVSKIIEQ